MHCSVFFVIFTFFVKSYAQQQVQMPEAGALNMLDDELSSQVETLQKNLTALWGYVYQLRGAISEHLNHLRQHQVELESSVHDLQFHQEGQSTAHTDSHHHSGEHQSHNSELHHSHGDQEHYHSHGDESHSHSHSDESHSHSHGDESHSDSHGDESHSHSHGHHSHGDEHAQYHSHSNENHEQSHSNTETDHQHHHGQKDSHETDDLQQSHQGADAILEPVVVATQVQSQSGHQHHSTSRPTSRNANGGEITLPLMGQQYHNHHHHHHSNGSAARLSSGDRTRSRVVIMPKYSEYDLYNFAVCNMRPNRAIPVELQQGVTGQVSLWQKKIGGPLNLHVKLQGFNMGGHHDHQSVQQEEHHQQEEDNETPPPVGHKHGFHIHNSGDLSNGCESAGLHFNPKSAKHGGPNSLVRHVGDLGNIECDEHGITNIVFSDGVASLQGPYSIVGKSLVVHSSADDYGQGGNEESLRTGNAGSRLACCIIEKVEKLPIRSYKAIKTASQYQN